MVKYVTISSLTVCTSLICSAMVETYISNLLYLVRFFCPDNFKAQKTFSENISAMIPRLSM